METQKVTTEFRMSMDKNNSKPYRQRVKYQRFLPGKWDKQTCVFLLAKEITRKSLYSN